MRDSQIAHVHVFVSDRPAAVEWLMTVWEAEPVAEDHEMSLFIFGSTQLVINDVADDIPSTVEFTSDNCDRYYRDVVARGAVSVDPPEDMPWGVRAAFVQGPGKLTFDAAYPGAGKGPATAREPCRREGGDDRGRREGNWNV
jgi:hypothetical protein